MKLFFSYFLLFSFVIAVKAQSTGLSVVERNEQSIKVFPGNNYYWQYKSKPIILIGGSKDDNLFQIHDLKGHLDLMQGIGANYIRNTMSSRDEGNVQPFQHINGSYDLTLWNKEYWQRFKKLLHLTYKRDIIIQIEIWAFHDFFGSWDKNPWNPKNNLSYSEDDVRLKKEKYGSYWNNLHDFFLSVPKVNNDEVLLGYQKRFVDKVLSYSLAYPNVLYCITNEVFSQFPPEWGYFWAGYIKQKASEYSVNVEVAEMYQSHDLDHEQHKATLDHPEIFSFIDISQNSRQYDENHWEMFHYVRNYIKSNPRPINHTKTYGGPRGEWTDGPEHGIERFWRSIIAGAAGIRFHRPPSGIGLNKRAQSHIKSMRMLLSEIDIIQAKPDGPHLLLMDRGFDEAFLTYNTGKFYALYFPDGGEVKLDLQDAPGTFSLKWLNTEGSNWYKNQDIKGGQRVSVKTPHKGDWVCVIVLK